MFKYKKTSLIFFLVAPFFAFISYEMISYYQYGDQVFYRSLYEGLASVDFYQVMPLVRAEVSGSEPLSGYVLWVGASLGVDKDFYISIFNFILLAGCFFSLCKYRVHPIFIFLILLNYYNFVLLTGAERLKFAYILIFLAPFFSGWKRSLILILSPLAHLQAVLLLPTFFLEKYKKDIYLMFASLKVRKNVLLDGCVLFLVFLSVFYFKFDSFLAKFNAYAGRDASVVDVYKISLLFFSYFILTREKVKSFFLFLYFIPMVLVLGPDRVNMIAFTSFLIMVVTEGRLGSLRISSIPMLGILLYFFYQSFYYVGRVIEHGDGFFFG